MVKQHTSIIHHDMYYTQMYTNQIETHRLVVRCDNEECLDSVGGGSRLPTIQKGFARVNSCDRSQTVMFADITVSRIYRSTIDV